jgi:hypothetical protein
MEAANTANVAQEVLNELHGYLNNSLSNASPAKDPKSSTILHVAAKAKYPQQRLLKMEPQAVYDSSTSLHQFQAQLSKNEEDINDGCLHAEIPYIKEPKSKIPEGSTDLRVALIEISPKSSENDDQSATASLNSMSEDESAKQECNDRAKKRLPAQETTRLHDIIGHEDAKLRIAELTLPLALPESILNSVFTGIRRLPTTILLTGPPGCGKVRSKLRYGPYSSALTSLTLDQACTSHCRRSCSRPHTSLAKRYPE